MDTGSKLALTVVAVLAAAMLAAMMIGRAFGMPLGDWVTMGALTGVAASAATVLGRFALD